MANRMNAETPIQMALLLNFRRRRAASHSVSDSGCPHLGQAGAEGEMSLLQFGQDSMAIRGASVIGQKTQYHTGFHLKTGSIFRSKCHCDKATLRSPMELKRHIGSRIRAARTQAKLTQQQLADRLGKSVDTISNLERGSVLASIETLSGVAAALSVPLAFFFREFPNDRPMSSRRGQLIEQLNVQALQLSDDELELANRLLAAIRPQ